MNSPRQQNEAAAPSQRESGVSWEARTNFAPSGALPNQRHSIAGPTTNPSSGTSPNGNTTTNTSSTLSAASFQSPQAAPSSRPFVTHNNAANSSATALNKSAFKSVLPTR